MPPFSVLHVCLGNICRSPMAERLLALRVSERAGEDAADLILSQSCGIGTWHTGQRMNGPAARELRGRGGSDSGFRARHMSREHVETADVILTATGEQVEYVAAEFPDALARTFLVRHFGRLAEAMTDDELPDSDGSPEAVYARGLAMVALADARRDTVEALELDDPWGESPEVFRRIGDEIDEALRPFVVRLLS
ncbi:protein-tyrosine phosphatase [Stackebrandtia albiflava]|uniref:protein-tyrosine-phosphatase n=1 Tax=Stackebrandtia albiflava TaxID=406432 RepID=A0A562V3J9_9ACTN|nr:phosphotyrosine protein phosphatase [Stackebrandtia albiflava]TWJ12461.1 protein-tyrosine phosphatase [Stackebrandtia albiflava]